MNDQNAKKMGLQSVSKGKLDEPIRAVIWGPAGLGKSTFASQAPSPIFLPTEDGTAQLDVARFPRPESLADCIEAVRTLTDEAHEYQTLVVDTLTHMEPLVWRSAIDANNRTTKGAKATNIDEVRGGFGKGYDAAVDEWRLFLAALERLRAKKRMHVVLIGHATVKNFKNPEGPDFERYELQLEKKAAGLFREWVDAYLFATYEAYADKDDKTKKAKGISTGARIVRTNWTAAYDAKNRYALPDPMPLAWADFYAATRKAAPADPAALLAAIDDKLAGLSEADQKTATDAKGRAAGDPVKLAQLNNWLNAKLAATR